jgi:hypothetical protein
MAIFYHMVDIAGINSLKLWMIKNPTWESKKPDRRRFLLQLGKNLIRDHSTRRYRNSTGLQTTVEKNIISAFPDLAVPPDPRNERAIPTESQDRCFICARSKDRKSRKYCACCKRFVCQQHLNITVKCQECFAKNTE